MGGDYLSAVRARGAMLIRGNSELQEHGLKGFLPVSEDWHAKVCLMEVSREFMSTLILYMFIITKPFILLHYRLYGSVYSQQTQLWRKEHFFSLEM